MPLLFDSPIKNRCQTCAACTEFYPADAIRNINTEFHYQSRNEAIDLDKCHSTPLKEKQMTQVYQIDGRYPFFPLSNRVIYITRGFSAEEDNTGIMLSEWLQVLKQVDALSLDEQSESYNPHTEETELWTERGRARCLSSTGQPEWFHYMPRHISATVARKLPSVRLLGRFNKVLNTIGTNPSLSSWREYVHGNKFLRLEEDFIMNGTPVSVPGRAVTLAKSGGTIVFRPSAVFIYFDHSPYEAKTPDPVYLAVSEKIAQLLKAEVNTTGFL